MELGRRIANRYVLEQLLGAGGMGEVYAARDPELQRRVAIKRVSPAFSGDQNYRRRLRREARAAAQLTHPGIAVVYDVVEDETEFYIVMELVEGQTLRQLSKPLDPRDFTHVAIQCAEALSAAHRRGIVHRDIKPANIILTRERKVKVLDFGLARLPPESLEEMTTNTSDRSKGPAGTLAYMAPEVLLGRESDHRIDIFALGIVFYELLTGRHPFSGGTRIPSADRIINSEPDRLRGINPGVPEVLEAIAAKMLSKAPDERYATADDLVVDLRALQRDMTLGRVRRPSAIPWRLPKVGRRSAALLALVSVLTAVAILYRRNLLDWFAGGALPELPNIAVLPWTTVGDDPEDVAFARGLSDTLPWRLSLLSRDHPFTVVPSSFVKVRQLATPEGIGEQLGASLALTGSLMRVGDSVEIALRLEKEGYGPLRRATVTETYSEPVALEYSLLEQTMEMLGLTIEPTDRQLLVAFSVRNPTVYHFYLRGLGQLAVQSPEATASAIGLLEQSVNLDPGFARGHVALARALLRDESEGPSGSRAPEARAHLEQAVALESELAEAHYWLGNLALDAGELEEAERSFERAQYLEPTNDDALRGLVQTYVKQRRYDRIAPAYQAAIGQNPDYWRTYDSLGAQLYRESRFQESISIMEQAIDKAPRYYRSYYILGAARAELGQWDEASRVFERSIAIHPTGIAYANLGTQYFYAGRFRDSIESLQKAIVFLDREKRLSFGVYGNLADALYWAPGERDKAALQYRLAIDMARSQLEGDPTKPEIHARIGTYYAMIGDGAAARRHASEAARLAPHDPQVLFHAAITYQQLEDSESAFDYLRRAVEAGTPTIKIKSHPLFSVDSLDTEYARFIRDL